MTVFDIDRNAPAIGRARLDIAAPPEAVWAVLTDLERWPDWNSGVEWVSAVPDLDPGTRFEWRAGGLTIRSVLQAAEAPRFIGWTGTAPFISARHVWHLSAEGAGTRVTTTFDAEAENPVEMQRDGWQAILDNYARHAGTR